MTEPTEPLALEDVQTIVRFIKLNLEYGQRQLAIDRGLGLLADEHLDTTTRITIQAILGVEYGASKQPDQALLMLSEAFSLAREMPCPDVDLLINCGHGTVRAQIALGDIAAAQQTLQLLEDTLMPPDDLKASLVNATQLIAHRELTDEIEHFFKGN